MNIRNLEDYVNQRIKMYNRETGRNIESFVYLSATADTTVIYLYDPQSRMRQNIVITYLDVIKGEAISKIEKVLESYPFKLSKLEQALK